MKRIATLMILLIALALPAAAQEYADGIYRGFYYDGGIEQIAIQFELKDGKFDSLVYRGVKYKDGDYMSEDASDAQKAILRQYRQLADYLVGKGVSAIDDLYSPYDIVEDLDAVTTATMKAGKLVSALWDGLNRHPYKIVDTTKLPEAEPYADGVYHGSYMEDGGEQVALEFGPFELGLQVTVVHLYQQAPFFHKTSLFEIDLYHLPGDLAGDIHLFVGQKRSDRPDTLLQRFIIRYENFDGNILSLFSTFPGRCNAVGHIGFSTVAHGKKNDRHRNNQY